jgi:hypothetical protein
LFFSFTVAAGIQNDSHAQEAGKYFYTSDCHELPRDGLKRKLINDFNFTNLKIRDKQVIFSLIGNLK